MPTAAKFMGAVAFAIVGFLTALAYIPQLPEATSTGYFPEITAALGLLIGWFAVGAQARRSYTEAGSLGLRGSIFLVFWALFGFSLYFMIRRSTKMLYHDAGEAVLDVPMLMMKYGKLMWAQQVIGALVIGGVLGGLLTEFAGRRWS